jgi:glycosyltransferase involved in cell wall biosynthesis
MSARRAVAVIHNPVHGGGTASIARLAAPLSELGWELVAVLPDLPEAAPTVARLRAAGVRTTTLELHRLRRTSDPRAHWALVASARREVRRLRALLRAERAAAVLAYGDTNPHAALAGHLERAAVVWTLYDTVTPPAARRLTMPVVRSLADTVVTWGRELGRVHPGIEALGPRWVTVFPPVDPSRFVPSQERRAAARARLALPADALVVGTLGNRNPSKGHEQLARAAARLGARGLDIHVRVLGARSPAHERETRAVDAEVEALGLAPRMTFSDPGDDVEGLLPAFDVFALSSVPRSEGAPTAIVEAMSCELPVVTTDVGAASELVADGATGFVVPPLDPARLAAALESLLLDQELRRRFGAAGRRRVVERYTVERSAEAYGLALERAVAHRAVRSS